MNQPILWTKEPCMCQISTPSQEYWNTLLALMSWSVQDPVMTFYGTETCNCQAQGQQVEFGYKR